MIIIACGKSGKHPMKPPVFVLLSVRCREICGCRKVVEKAVVKGWKNMENGGKTLLYARQKNNKSYPEVFPLFFHAFHRVIHRYSLSLHL